MGYVMFNGYKVEETKPVSISSKIDKLYFLFNYFDKTVFLW